MNIAKSYKDLEIVGEIFVSSGRKYVNVKLKSGKLKTVRVYSDAEYQKMYPAETRSTERKTKLKTQKEIFGFDKGYITIFKGDTYSELDWFRCSNARYANMWGWYVVSTEEVPEDLPKVLTAIQLDWELVGNTDGSLKEDKVIKEAVESIIYEETESEYVGSIGERLELYLTVEKIIELDNAYGYSHMFQFRDDCGNCFIWTTATQQNFKVDDEIHIRGTVKDHRKYKGDKQTVLNRCIKVK